MQWYYGVGKEVCGPVENDGLVRLVSAGEVRPETPVWASYLGNWTPAGQIEGLFAAAGVPATPPPSPAPAVQGREVGAVAHAMAGSAVAGSAGGGTLPSPAESAAQVPRVETSRLGLTAAPPKEVVAQSASGIALNPAGQEAGLLDPQAGGQRGQQPVTQAAQAALQGHHATPPGSVLNPGGIPVPNGPTPDETATERAPLEPLERGAPAPISPAGGSSSATSSLAPGLREKPSGDGQGWKKWLLPGVAAVVLLGGGAALADRFLLGGKFFGFGARPSGPHAYYPNSPKFAVNVEIRGLLFNPVVAGKIDAGGGMNMVDQMMQSAVGLRPYDIKDIKVVGGEISMMAPRFVCIITTTKKIPEELVVEKFFGDARPEKAGGRKIYEVPMMRGGDIVACIADETTFLLGGRSELVSVLERTEDPVFARGELEMVTAATDSDALFSMSFDCKILSDLGDLAGGLPGASTAMPPNFFARESMQSAKMAVISIGIADEFEIHYQIEFDSEASAELALEEVREEFEQMGEADIAAQLAAGGIPAGTADYKMLRKMVEAIEISREGVSVVMHMGLPIELFEKMIGQGMGQRVGATGPF